MQAWLQNVEASHSEVIETQLRKDKKNKVRPNELLQRAYALASDTSVGRFDLVTGGPVPQADLADLTRPPVIDKLWLPFREVFLNVHHTPCAFHERPPNDRCLHAWAKHGSRFSDALRIIPRRMLPDIKQPSTSSSGTGVWDQHGLAFQLKKLRGIDISQNVTPLVEGFWDSNIDTRQSLVYSARGARASCRSCRRASGRPSSRACLCAMAWRRSSRVCGDAVERARGDGDGASARRLRDGVDVRRGSTPRSLASPTPPTKKHDRMDRHSPEKNSHDVQ